MRYDLKCDMCEGTGIYPVADGPDDYQMVECVCGVIEPVFVNKGYELCVKRFAAANGDTDYYDGMNTDGSFISAHY